MASPVTPRSAQQSSESNQLVLPPITPQKAKGVKVQSPRTHGRGSSQAAQHLDAVPQELLATLTRHQRAPVAATDGSPGAAEKRNRKHPAVSKAKPAAAWNFPAQRARFKHLTDQTVCFCGAGKDVSFIYDASLSSKASGDATKALLPLHECPVSNAGKQSNGGEKANQTMVPNDFHICRTSGVLGIDIMDSELTTKTREHPRHSVAFPSLNPAGRQQVLALKHSLAAMLKQAALDDAMELTGPTQIHNLLELIRKEQDIYNICFHEVIRQVSVECVERGQILAEIRERYNKLLNRIPGQVMSLHEELLAQRSLDRQLACELQKFESQVSSLSGKLKSVNSHDEFVQKEAETVREELAEALAESQKNANLLKEYHELYELQRRRLEFQQGKLLVEKDSWQTAAYSLAFKVTDEQCLQTCRRLQLCERCWYKLAMRFAVLLSDFDMGEIRVLHDHMHSWERKIGQVCRHLDRQDVVLMKEIREVVESMTQWSQRLSSTVTKGDGVVNVPGQDFCKELLAAMRKWESTARQLAERYSGNNVVEGEASLDELRQCVLGWTEVAMRLYNRHRPTDAEFHPDRERTRELNARVDAFHEELSLRVAGGNGVADNLVQLANPLESWAYKVDLVANSDRMLADSDWDRLRVLVGQWQWTLHEVMAQVRGVPKKPAADPDAPESGTGAEADTGAPVTSKPDNVPTAVNKGTASATAEPPAAKVTAEQEAASTATAGTSAANLTPAKTDLEKLVFSVTTWLTASMNRLEIADASIVQQVSDLHGDLIHWIISLLLVLTRTPEDKHDRRVERREQEVLTGDVKAVELGKEHVEDHAEEEEDQQTIASLHVRCQMLTNKVSSFTALLFQCGSDMIQARFVVSRDFKDLDEDEDYNDLKRLQGENEAWQQSADMLLKEVDAVLSGMTPASAITSAADIAAKPAQQRSAPRLATPEVRVVVEKASDLPAAAGGARQSLRQASRASEAVTLSPEPAQGGAGEVEDSAGTDTDKDAVPISVIGVDDNVHPRSLDGILPPEELVQHTPVTALQADAALPKSEFGVESEAFAGAVQAMREKVTELEVQCGEAEARAQASEVEASELRRQLEELKAKQQQPPKGQQRSTSRRR